jgi:hypothetical protein
VTHCDLAAAGFPAGDRRGLVSRDDSMIWVAQPGAHSPVPPGRARRRGPGCPARPPLRPRPLTGSPVSLVRVTRLRRPRHCAGPGVPLAARGGPTR